MALLQVRELSAGYGEVQVLHGISFTVNEGEIVAIVGSNGAGKTTLLKTISGLLAMKAGDITFAGQSVGSMPPHRIVESGVVQVPEGRQLFPHMTVMENLDIGAVNPHARGKKKETLKAMLELFPMLAERQGQLARTLSGGEQQMVATARALMACPRLLMMDEPSMGLAPIIVKQLFETVRQINQQGTTILLVEQDVQQALTMANRGYVLENGHVIMEGTGANLLANPDLKAAYLGL